MVSFRRYREEDVRPIVELVSQGMADREYDERYFRWKYTPYEAGGGVVVEPVGLVVEAGGAMAGFAGIVPFPMAHGGMIWYLDDFVVAPAERGKGTFREMIRESLEFIDQKGEDSYLFFIIEGIGNVLRDYKPLFELPYYVMVPSWRNLLGGKGRAAAFAGGVIDLLRMRGRGGGHGDINISRIDSFPAELDDAMRQSAGAAAFSIKRSAGYLNWRFTRNPRHEYECYLAKGGDEITGYVVIRGQNVLDIWARDEGVFSALLEFARDDAIRAGKKMMHMFLHSPVDFSGAISRAGFRRWKWKARPFGMYRRHLVLLRKSPSGSAVEGYGDWYFTMGDINCAL